MCHRCAADVPPMCRRCAGFFYLEKIWQIVFFARYPLSAIRYPPLPTLKWPWLKKLSGLDFFSFYSEKPNFSWLFSWLFFEHWGGFVNSWLFSTIILINRLSFIYYIFGRIQKKSRITSIYEKKSRKKSRKSQDPIWNREKSHEKVDSCLEIQHFFVFLQILRRRGGPTVRPTVGFYDGAVGRPYDFPAAR